MYDPQWLYRDMVRDPEWLEGKSRDELYVGYTGILIFHEGIRHTSLDRMYDIGLCIHMTGRLFAEEGAYVVEPPDMVIMLVGDKDSVESVDFRSEELLSEVGAAVYE